MFCDKCGKKLGQGESFCTNCGNKIVAVQEEKPRCSKCGTFAAENAKFCPICGTGIKQPEEKLHCAECGALANKNAEFCQMCGVAIQKPEEKPAKILCKSCGEEFGEDEKFCKKCGTPKEGKANTNKSGGNFFEDLGKKISNFTQKNFKSSASNSNNSVSVKTGIMSNVPLTTRYIILVALIAMVFVFWVAPSLSFTVDYYNSSNYISYNGKFSVSMADLYKDGELMYCLERFADFDEDLLSIGAAIYSITSIVIDIVPLVFSLFLAFFSIFNRQELKFGYKVLLVFIAAKTLISFLGSFILFIVFSIVFGVMSVSLTVGGWMLLLLLISLIVYIFKGIPKASR